MAELVALADKSGWLIVVIILAAWKFIPALADKIAPEWMAAQREAAAANRASQNNLTEKLISVVENNSRMAGALAASVNSFERSLDGNTQQTARLTDIVQKGPSCPLPDCPFMNTSDGRPIENG